MLLVAIALAVLPLRVPEGAFSDLCLEKQSGDTGGHYVQISHNSRGVFLSYGATDGSIDKPVRASRTQFHSRTGQLTFKAKTWEKVSFNGKLTGQTLFGVLSHGGQGAEHVQLLKVESLSPPYPPCR